MNRTLSLMCMLILIMFSLPLKAQNGRVSGCITDSDGLPVIGASILVKGTTNGIISMRPYRLHNKYLYGKRLG